MRAKIIAAGAPYIQDVGAHRPEHEGSGAPWCSPPARCVRSAACPPTPRCHDVLNSEPVLAHFQRVVNDLAKTSTGSASRIARLCLLADAPTIDRGEITDKGSNQPARGARTPGRDRGAPARRHAARHSETPVKTGRHGFPRILQRVRRRLVAGRRAHPDGGLLRRARPHFADRPGHQGRSRSAGPRRCAGRTRRFGRHRQHGPRRLRPVLPAAPHRSVRRRAGGGAGHHGAAHLRHRLRAVPPGR